MKVSLTGGEWVELREPTAVRNRDRRLAVMFMEQAPEGVARGYANGYAVVALLVEEWSFTSPVPSLVPEGLGVKAVNMDSLDDLTPTQFDEIARAAQPARDAIFPKFDQDTGPGSPFVESSESEPS